MAENESFPIKNIQDMSVMDLGRLALAKSILTEDPRNFVVSVHKLEPFIVEDWTAYDTEIERIKSELAKNVNPTTDDFQIRLAVLKYRLLVKKMKRTMPLDVVGLI